MPPIRGTHGFMAVIVEIKGRHRPVVDEGPSSMCRNLPRNDF